MWTSTMDLDQKKVLLTQILGRFYPNIYYSSYSPLQVQNSPRQSLPESSWVRVRNRLSGICGSDLHLLYRGGSDQRVASAARPVQKQFYPGHEVVGEVIEIGDDVQHVHVGERVALQWRPNCVTAGVQPLCYACSTGNYNLCDHGSFLAPQPLGGGWSEEMLLHEQQLFRVPSALTDEQAVMLEPVAVALHAVLRHLPRPGDQVLIIGAGTVGLLVQQIVRALVPQCEISMLARYTFQVEQATRLGANHIIYPRDAYEGVQQATNAKIYNGMFGNRTLQGGYNVIYDTVGQKRGMFHRNTLHHALRWIRSRGTIVLVGLNLQPMNIDLTPLWHQEISLLGSQQHGTEYWPVGSHEQTSTFRVACELIQQRRIAPEQLITHHFALDNYQNALLTARKKSDSRAIKVVFDYSLLPASVVPNVRASAPRIRRQSTINFMEDFEDTGEQTPHTSGSLNDQSDIPSARPYTKELAKTPKQEPAEDDFDDDDTATALPALGKRFTGNLRPYVPQSQMHGNLDHPAFKKQDEPVPVPADSQEFATHNEIEEKTQLIPQPPQVPHTETDLNLDSDATMLFSRASILHSGSDDELDDESTPSTASPSLNEAHVLDDEPALVAGNSSLDEVHEPEGEVHEPEGEVHEPEGEVHEPEDEVHEPEDEVHEPEDESTPIASSPSLDETYKPEDESTPVAASSSLDGAHVPEDEPAPEVVELSSPDMKDPALPDISSGDSENEVDTADTASATDTAPDEEALAVSVANEDQLAIPVEKNYSDTDADSEQAAIETDEEPTAVVLAAEAPEMEPSAQEAIDLPPVADPAIPQSTTDEEVVQQEQPEPENVSTVDTEKAPAMTEETSAVAPDESVETMTPTADTDHTDEASVAEQPAKSTATISTADALQQVEGPQAKRVQQRSRTRKKKAGSRKGD